MSVMISHLGCQDRVFSGPADEAVFVVAAVKLMLPFRPEGVGGNSRVRSKYDEPAGNGLTDEYSVKGVFVIVRQTGKLKDCGFVQG